MAAEQEGRILIVEDDAMVAMVIQYMLEDRGYEIVGIAKDGLSAVESAAELRPDVVLMDLRMPRMDGFEATRRIMRECPAPVIALTAYGDADYKARAFDAGMVGYLVKPATAQELDDAIFLARSHTPQS